MDGITRGTGLKQLILASRRITSHLELDKVLEQIASTLTTELGALYSAIWIVERGDVCDGCPHKEECLDPDECLHLMAWDGPRDLSHTMGKRVPAGLMKVNVIAMSGSPYITDDLAADPLLVDPAWVREQGVVGFAGFPLVHDGRLIGLLAYFSDKPLDPELGDILTYVAHHSSMAIEDARQHERVRQSEERYKALIDGAIDAVFIFGLDGGMLNVSRSACRMSGFDKDALLMMNIRDLDLSPDTKLSSFFEELGSGGAITYDTALGTKSGDRLPVEVRAGTIKFGAGLAVQAFVRDITERKKLEGQKADYVSMLTHDLKGPLSIIMGYTEVIKNQYMAGLPDFVREGVESIRISGEKLLSMIEGYLDLSRMEAGVLPMAKRPVALPALLNRAMDTVFFKAEEKKLTLTLSCPADMPEVMADAKHLERAVSNLVINAANYTPRGGTITVGCGVDKARKVAEITVADTGIGISQEDMSRIFDMYFRAGRTVKGAGLGLAIVKSVVEGHGGTVTVESEPGSGSTFTITLPVQ